jgi:hypothetical protein
VQNFFLLEKDVVGADGATRRVLDEGEIVTMRSAFKPLVGSSPTYSALHLGAYWLENGSLLGKHLL